MGNKVDINIKIPAFEKLIDVTASGIGAVCGPWLAKWRAKQEAEARRITAQSRKDELLIQGKALLELIKEAQTQAHNLSDNHESLLQGSVDINEEIQTRFIFQEQKRQSNIESVFYKSAEKLDGKKVNDHEVDHDWTAKFFSGVMDVSSENLQDIWARILAREVEDPGHTSLHTLAILKNMSRSDAELFENVCCLTFYDGVFLDKQYIKNLSKYPNLNDLLRLDSYGLLTVDNLLANKIIPETPFISNTKAFRIKPTLITDTSSQLNFPIFPLTPQGIELYNIVGADIDDNYLQAIAKFISVKGFQLEQATILEKIGSDRVQLEPWSLVSNDVTDTISPRKPVPTRPNKPDQNDNRKNK